MPPAVRGLRRAVTDENAENVGTTRLTRAKAAALETTNVADPPKKAPLAKRTTSTTNLTTGTQPQRKRSALGDVSNVNKSETIDSKGLGKGALSKAQKPAGITKNSRTTSRTALGVKTNSNSSELKRPGSGSGVSGNATKKRVRSLSKSVPEENLDDSTESNPPAETAVKKQQPVSQRARDVQVEDVTVDNDEPEYKTLDALCKEAKDLDSEDFDDPLMVAEYVHEIFDYMRELEISTLPNADYMDLQSELEWKMRGILIDWLLEVHSRFRLLPETLFLTVNIIDRFLSRKVVQLDRLQLVGVTAMFIASKYEEVLSPHVQNFRHVADDGFTETEILSAERFILAALDYDLSYPNPMNFLRRISKADNYDIQTRTLGKYLLEIGCVDHRFIKYPPSHVAAASMYLARLVLDRGEWDATLSKYAGYTEQDIEPVFKLMVDYLSAPVVHDAFFRKYASKKFLKASIILRQWAKKWAPTYLDGAEGSAGSGSETPVV
ncbi:G2/mitotic-specific cyclin cdc13 [Sphaceloma murrayae]|uniref:G2/mitotic-specific cyclin cdc13 n=1 Tax=Sphaceloma murrayae TaxID=2082308 RepID=A0A2K1QXS3_9PEZI|nr:G2/mitotic-specific cyclin cdc13 [Sphaceloma murrayae]